MAGELGQGICYQSVDALAFNLSLDGQLGMKFWADAETEIAGIGFVWFFANLSACFQIVVNRLLESCSHFTDGISVKAYNVPDAQNVADQASIFGAIFNAGGIAFINHGVHGLPHHFQKNPGVIDLVCFGFFSRMRSMESGRQISGHKAHPGASSLDQLGPHGNERSLDIGPVNGAALWFGEYGRQSFWCRLFMNLMIPLFATMSSSPGGRYVIDKSKATTRTKDPRGGKF
jgi:hypothetical protein